MEKLPLADLSPVAGERLPAPTPKKETIDILAAAERVAAQTVTAKKSLPPHVTARVDGLANTGLQDGATYLVTATSLPGDAPPPAPKKNEAVRVATGGPLPAGCAGVVPVEHTEPAGGQAEPAGDQVRVIQAMNVPAIPTGGQIAKGKELIRQGAPVRAHQAGWLADLGETRIEVYTRPQVAILATGSELTDAGDTVNGNAVRLAMAVQKAGGVALVLPPAPDEAEAIATAILSTDAPLILTTGGTARGVRDVTGKAIEQAGFKLILDGLNARPGQSLRLGINKNQILLSLPGMPGGLPSLCALLVTPLVHRLAGKTDWEPAWFTAELAAPHDEHRPMPLLANAELRVTPDGLRATVVPSVANGFVVLPKGREALAAGTALAALCTDVPLPG